MLGLSISTKLTKIVISNFTVTDLFIYVKYNFNIV